MKKIFLSIVAATLVLQGCDKIEGNQFEDLTGVNTGQRVLIEEFTGHKCGNCPEGTKEIQKLISKYGGQLVPVSIHAGSFATTSSSGKYSYDFRTESGVELNTNYDVENSGYPAATINRKTVNGKRVFGRSAWASEIQKILTTIPSYKIDIKNEYNKNNHEVTSEVTIKYLNTGTADGLNLVVYVTEDSIINWQKDYSLKPNEDVQNYVHRHVLRSSINGTFGQPFASGKIVQNATIKKSFTYKLSRMGKDGKEEFFNPERCSVVAFIANKTDYAVQQVAEKHVME